MFALFLHPLFMEDEGRYTFIDTFSSLEEVNDYIKNNIDNYRIREDYRVFIEMPR